MIEETLQHDRHNVRSFRCGNLALDTWLRGAAVKAMHAGTAHTRVLIEGDPSTGRAPILGYYSLAAATIVMEDILETDRQNLPKHPIPACLLARLAVSSDYHRKGLGGALLARACLRILQASDLLGISFIVVDAIDDNAIRFYRRYDFTPAGTPNRLYMAVGRAKSLSKLLP